MTSTDNQDKYYILEVENPEGMLLYSLPDPTDDPFEDSWLRGSPFISPIKQNPVIATIVTGHERDELLPYFDAPPVISNAFHQALIEAGVDNLDAYDCILRSEDGTIEYKGFKAVNIIGVIRATGDGTVFTSESRLIDASMDKVVIDPRKTMNALMFRLAESVTTVVVHERVKRYIEKKGFPSIVFREPSDTLVL